MADILEALTELFTLLGVLFGIYLTWKSQRKMAEVKEDVRTIEIATNSMKDALVAATRASAHAAGREEARVEGEEKAADLAENQQKK